MSAPNHEHIVAQMRDAYPEAWRQAHTGSSQTWDFIRLLASKLHSIDSRFGLNGKRGNGNDLSQDCVAYLDDASPLVGADGRRLWIIDVIAGAGGNNPQPAWIDQTRATMNGGTTGLWVQPAPVVEQPPAPAPTPQPPTPPAPDYSKELAAIRVDLAAILARINEQDDAIRDAAFEARNAAVRALDILDKLAQLEPRRWPDYRGSVLGMGITLRPQDQ